MDEMRSLHVTRLEAELIMDSFKVTNPLTRCLALKTAGLVLEFAADEALAESKLLVGRAPTDPLQAAKGAVS